ncbi:kelch-like protein 13 isoform X5 [Sceloporus undulatus]|uniref:kelch-like protein 13 isoform X5 n=1 Tax=Sceloporus undulatus TaxID=8520 RepID=UPI001C4CAC7A|nr:kelch-like protein 13 isoform X5 [Sceloporus undulatus]
MCVCERENTLLNVALQRSLQRMLAWLLVHSELGIAWQKVCKQPRSHFSVLEMMWRDTLGVTNLDGMDHSVLRREVPSVLHDSSKEECSEDDKCILSRIVVTNMPLKWKTSSPAIWKFPVPVLKTSRSSPLSPAYISLVEEEDPHMKVSLGSSDMGVSAHLQSSKTGTTRFFTSNTHSSVVLQVSLENCVEVGRIANTYNLTEVDKYVNNFILKNFPALLSTGEFVKLPFERLAFVLSSNSLKHCTELELFKAACRWLRYEELRMECAAKLMKNIRFPLMTPQDLINYVQTVDFMRTDNTCVNLLLEASNYQMMPYMQPVMQSERTAIRSDSTHLVTLGGVLRQQLVVSKELRMYDEKAHEWRSLAPMDAPRYQHGIAVIGNFLYVVGGQSNYDTKGKTAVDTVFRFDPRYNKWMQVASLNEKRTFFHLSALKGHLYAVGGRNAAGELATVECYNPRMNEWSYVAKMNEPHYGHAGTVYGGLMYISGGITHDTFQKELMCFDPDTDKWTQKAPMTTVRGLHCMCTVGDKLYVIGGNHFRGTSDYDDVLSCEYYSPTLDQWTPIAAMLRGQSDVGVAVFENKIYVVGGYSWNNRCMVEIVQKYDPEKDEWHKVFDLPESLGGIRACTLTVFPPEDNTGSPSRESPLSAP